MNILFVTWDGPQVSYLQSLFLPIFRKLEADGLHFHVLQFTWADAHRIEQERLACADAGISYRAVEVRRWPKALGALITSVLGGRQVRRAVRELAIDVIMPRSTLPGLSALLAGRGGALPIVFDADGLALDERVDFAGQSPKSIVYRILRDIETQLVQRAAVVLTRSAKASQIMIARAGAGSDAEKFFVVGNGRDADQFHPHDLATRSRVRAELGVATDAPLLVYAGSMGPQYCAVEMLRLFELVRTHRPDAILLVLSHSAEYFEKALANFRLPAATVLLRAIEPREVPRYLACCDLGLALRRPSFSMQGVAPIKVGEYLLCGLPVAATEGIGDTDMLEAQTGVLLKRMDELELQAAANWFVDTVLPRREVVRAHCNRLGLSRFSLDACVTQYRAALQSLLSCSER